MEEFHKDRSWDEYTVLYVNNTSHIFSEDNDKILIRRAQNTMAALNEYFSANDLLWNALKTQTLLFSNRNSDTIKFSYKNKDLQSNRLLIL